VESSSLDIPASIVFKNTCLIMAGSPFWSNTLSKDRTTRSYADGRHSSGFRQNVDVSFAVAVKELPDVVNDARCDSEFFRAWILRSPESLNAEEPVMTRQRRSDSKQVKRGHREPVHARSFQIAGVLDEREDDVYPSIEDIDHGNDGVAKAFSSCYNRALDQEHKQDDDVEWNRDWSR
jgi:hypothetical protein